MKPISMSTASAMPPELPASRQDWIIAPASMKSRKPFTSGKARQINGPRGSAGLHRQEERREDDDRRHQLGAPEGLADRAPAERRDDPRVLGERSQALALGRRRLGLGCGLLVVALQVVARLLDEDVVERRLDQVEALDGQPGVVERAHDGRNA